MSIHQLKYIQLIPAPLTEVWNFISSPKNLKKITPPYMGFDIKTPDLPEKMYQGMIIAYTVRPLFNVPMTWVTEITHIDEGKYFVDEQRYGPYRMWHHEHFIETHPGGTLMRDLVSYIPPFAFLGQWVNPSLIRSKIEEIFNFRQKALEEIFGR